MIQMSSGHHHNHVHRADLMRELESLLRDPAIQGYLQQRYSVDTQHPVPLTGGSSQDGSVYYLNPDIPKEDMPFVLWHERVEKALRAVKGMTYSRAHDLATTAERLLVEAHGRPWEQYRARIAQVVRLNEYRPARMPSGFDVGPYRESGMMHLLEGV